MNEHHRMDADMLVDDELHPCEPDPVIRQHCGVVGKLGIAEIDHDRSARTEQHPGCNSGYLVWQFSIAEDYTVRIVPRRTGAAVPAELALMLWQK
jgi:hypothetical protein